MKTRNYLSILILLSTLSAHADPVFQATGVKVGEVTFNEARVWTRLTAAETRNATGFLRKGRPAEVLPDDLEISQIEGSCPGAPGKVRIWYASQKDLEEAGKSLEALPAEDSFQITDWQEVEKESDFTHTFHLLGLDPSTDYAGYVETDREDYEGQEGLLPFRFQTAPLPDASAPVTFTVITGQMYSDTDRPDGFEIYPAMADLKPHFLVSTGDTVYYDNEDPRATTVPVARYHWHRMYSFPTLRDFHTSHPAYWIKDDHDTYSNDCWPGIDEEKMKPLKFEEGQEVFLEQVPMSEKTYRTFRWGKHLQIWLPEGRDFRSPNPMPDGPEKTLLGQEQKEWLKESMLESDADWKILVSATPVVGPDRPTKGDNHANMAFAHEGRELREFFAEHFPDNFFVVCGDRHWQYHSKDPETSVEEFSCGPASDAHAGGFPQDPAFDYLWSRVKGGFLSVTVAPKGTGSALILRHHDVEGNVVHEVKKKL